MIPKSSKPISEMIPIEAIPTRTYAMDRDENTIAGYCDRLEAMKQVVYKILNTERYVSPVYSWNYGVELADLLGKSKHYVCPEVERRIKEALTQDERIQSVSAFAFDTVKQGVLHTSFAVQTVFGTLELDKEVDF